VDLSLLILLIHTAHTKSSDQAYIWPYWQLNHHLTSEVLQTHCTNTCEL